MNILKSNDIDLACDSFGDEAATAILLIAGLGTQMIRWTAPFCEELAARGYRVIRFDNRDAGCSTHLRDQPAQDFGTLAAELMAGRRPDVPYTLFDMAADAIGLLDALSIDKVHVVGRSMGGMIAQIAASDHAERVLSLTSIMSSTGNPALPSAAADIIAMMTRQQPNPFANQEEFLMHSVALARRIAGTGYPFDEDLHRALVLEEARRAYDPSGSGRQMAAMAVTGDRRSRLASVAVPSLIIHGTDDPLILPACGVETANVIPGAGLMLIDGMGHDVPHALYGTIVSAIEQNASCARR